MSLHLYHGPEADMLECSLEILLNDPYLKTYTFEYAAPCMGVRTMMYWQMTHIWWLLRNNYLHDILLVELLAEFA
jgi:hypothetical protein